MVAIANTYWAINPAFTTINNEESSWLHQPRKLQLKITHLNFLKASLLKKSPYRFKSLLKVSNGKAGRCHWWSASCTSLLRIYPSDGIEKISPRHLSIDHSRHHHGNDHGWKLRQVSFFEAVFTAAIQETCKIVGMSPIFRCLGCGQFIERSLTAYKKHKGQIFCSTCNDRKQIEAAADSKKA